MPTGMPRRSLNWQIEVGYCATVIRRCGGPPKILTTRKVAPVFGTPRLG